MKLNASSGSLSSVPNGQIIDFEEAELRIGPSLDEPYLWVKGKLPGSAFEAQLAPRIYHDRPDYWGIEVAAIMGPSPDNDTGEDDGPVCFERSVPLSGITGVRGITVIGASQLKRIEVSGESV